jgi:hypothetical protein
MDDSGSVADARDSKHGPHILSPHQQSTDYLRQNSENWSPDHS